MSPKSQIYIFGGPEDNVSFGPYCLGIKTEDELNLFDSGIGVTSKGDKGGYPPNFEMLKKNGLKVNNVALTHFHEDHVAYIPYLQNQGLLVPEGKIFGSAPTLRMSSQKWLDNRDIKRRENPGRKVGYTFLPDYYETTARFERIQSPGGFEMGSLDVETRGAGHTFGATSYTVTLPSGKKLLIMGDVSWDDQAIVRGMSMPDTWSESSVPDMIATDLTNFSPRNEKEKTYQQKRQELLEVIPKFLSESKTVVLMAFTTGKGENLAIEIANLGFDVWIDGGIEKYYELMREGVGTELDQPLPPLGDESRIRQIRDRRHRQELMEDPNRKVIIAPGGMGDHGPIVDWFEVGLPKDNFVFIATSYLSPNSNGRKLCDLVLRYPDFEASLGRRTFKLEVTDEKGDKKKVVLEVKAHVQQMGPSSHGTARDLISFIKMIVKMRGRKLHAIFLVHGTYDSMIFAARVLGPYARSVVPGLPGAKFEV